jgi:hypothetical protein
VVLASIAGISLLVGGLVGSALGYGITFKPGQTFPGGLSVSALGLFLAAGPSLLVRLSHSAH